uniref:Protein kinase domain-containing protein n=1 Tax=Gasterosteus aculeatus aculeatus TaxID=481459 RepID=A0AAQ4NQ13_GASAC
MDNSKSEESSLLEFIGEGCFGKVAKCVNMNTNENTAIKILKDPFRVKLIDFGLAMPASEVWEGMIVQPCAYRAPEVSL